MLFSDQPRTLQGGMLPGMGPFNYLDQSARQAAKAVREQLEAMLSRYPEAARDDLAKRLRSNNEDTHNAAFFELALHELVTRSAAFRLAAVEPALQGVLTRPDFLFVDETGVEFFLEAAVATGMSKVEAKKLLERDKVLDALYLVKHPAFKFHLRDMTLPASTVGSNAIQQAVKARLNQFAAEVEGVAGSPMAAKQTLQLDIKGLKLEITPVARRPGDDLSGPGIASVFYGVKGVRSGAAISAKTLGKAGKYGDLGRPFFIAVNSTQAIQRDEDFEAALFGTLQFTWNDDADEPEVGRARDGALLEGEVPRYTRVSGVLCFYNLTPWTLGTARARIIENPNAVHPYDLQSLELPTAKVQGQELVTLPGKSIPELLGLPANWPGD